MSAMLTHDEAPLTSSQAPPFGLHETLTIPSVAELTLGEPSHRLPWLRSLGQTTSMDRYDSRCEDLWEKALQTLSNDDLNRINIHEDDRRIVLEDILSIVAEKQEVCDRKRWKYKRKNGEEVIIRDVLTKITHGINKFKDVGDNLVQYDPHHAALPWAAIRLVLQVCNFFFPDSRQAFFPRLEIRVDGWRASQIDGESSSHNLSPALIEVLGSCE